ncbi:hypothetical protein OC842_002466 [Tilletia horrida]|uniref:Uncharacterized protein n=1 Tax=Tilletia horrida TaxID=155126 RepID=A0AAN6JLB2_9BASI|nr:hypothetical protein OC842_002466 [Tilletia horrida]
MSTVGDMASSSVDADMDERDDSDALSITSDLDAPTPVAPDYEADHELWRPHFAPISARIAKVRSALKEGGRLLLDGIEAV